MFRAILCPSSGAQDCDSMWYNVPRLLSVGDLECDGTDCVLGEKDVARLRVEQHPSL